MAMGARRLRWGMTAHVPRQHANGQKGQRPFARWLCRLDHSRKGVVAGTGRSTNPGFPSEWPGLRKARTSHPEYRTCIVANPCHVRTGKETSYARRQLLLPVSDNYFCRRRVSKGVSPTTWRHSVVVVGRSVAVKDVSAGAPAGAEAPAEIPGMPARESPDRFVGARFMAWARRPDGAWPCRGVSRARSGSWGHQIPAGPSDAPGDRSPRPSPSDRGRSDPSARRSDCW